MRVVFCPVLALSFAIAVLAEVRAQAAPPDKGRNAEAEEGVDPNSLFPLAKRNGIEMRIVERSTSPDGNIVRKDIVPSFVGGKKALKKIVAHPENATAIQLAVAADTSYRAGNLQEAAFLFYAARLRVYQDIEKYPPKESSSASTNWFLSVLLDGVKIDLLRDLYIKPKTLAKVVKRIEAFVLKEPAGYNPGWDYTRHDVPAGLFAKNKAIVLENMKPTSELLLLPEYFEAFCALRTCNELSEEGQKDVAVAERRSKALAAMRRIEKEKKLHGVIFQTEQNPPD